MGQWLSDKACLNEDKLSRMNIKHRHHSTLSLGCYCLNVVLIPRAKQTSPKYHHENTKPNIL